MTVLEFATPTVSISGNSSPVTAPRSLKQGTCSSASPGWRRRSSSTPGRSTSPARCALGHSCRAAAFDQCQRRDRVDSRHRRVPEVLRVSSHHQIATRRLGRRRAHRVLEVRHAETECPLEHAPVHGRHLEHLHQIRDEASRRGGVDLRRQQVVDGRHTLGRNETPDLAFFGEPRPGPLRGACGDRGRCRGRGRL